MCGEQKWRQSKSATTDISFSCLMSAVNAALPGWARTGFRGDGAGVPHVLSEHSGLVAVLFDYPPVASADPDVGNKILWVSRLSQQPMRPLRIEAALNGTKISVIREIPGGAGPSMVNLPKAGCWHLALSWSGHTDVMTLKFS
jgi:hypothetical protein